jgi:phytoene dehydrogenase-like protein
MTGLPERVDTVVVGAGLAGLAAAGTLRRGGRSVAVLEASDGVGGRVRTDLVDGCRLDRGFQVLLTAYPELDRQLDVEALELRAFDPGALVWLGDGFAEVADPRRHPARAWSTLRAPIGSVPDKLRVLALMARLLRRTVPELLRQPDGSTEDALRDAGFSDRIVERFFRPLVGGILLDPTLATSHRMFDAILRSLAVGDAAVPARGMGAIPAQMAGRLGHDVIHLGRAVTAVTPGEVTVQGGDRVAADQVVVATEGPVAARLLGLPPVGSRPATCVWFRADRAPTGSRAIILDGTGSGPALNVAVMTNVAPTYAEDGSAVIAAACPGVADGGAADGVRAQLRAWWGPRVDGWDHLRTDVIEHGQPEQYPPLRPKQRVALGDGLFVCGDHRDTGSIQGALFSGRRCAAAVLSAG